jgi:predicted nucleotidyltransferase
MTGQVQQTRRATQCDAMARAAAAPGTEEGWRVVDAAVCSAHARLGDDLLSAYVIGSLAHGGFTASVSDVDVALLTGGAGLDARATVAAIAADVADAGLALGDRLSLFHAPWDRFNDPPAQARFPPIDRYDLVRYGILVAGDELRSRYASAPTPGEIREQAVDSALRRVTPEQLGTELVQLERAGVSVHDATKLVLWPVRLQHVCDAGEATGNRAAVDHYLQLPDARHRSLVTDALAWRALQAIAEPRSALQRINGEIHDLHAEVFLRLAGQPGVPRRAELERRGRLLTVG